MSERIGPSAVDVQIDRLVDGELGEHEYRALLALLDDEPDGWRRCALAFLEAQALRHDLTEICQGVPSGVEAEIRPAHRTSGISRNMAWVVTVAASLLLAFCLGWSMRSGSLEGNLSVPQVATPQRTSVVSPVTEIARSAVEDQKADSEVQLPAVSVDEQYAAALADDTAIVPPDIQTALEGLGYVIRRDRQWAPLESAGRRVFVPLEQVEIRPISTHAY